MNSTWKNIWEYWKLNMGKVSRVKQRTDRLIRKGKNFMGIRTKAVNDVNKENIDTSLNMDITIDFQNDETSAPVTPKSASFHKLENIKSPVKEKNSQDIE